MSRRCKRALSSQGGCVCRRQCSCDETMFENKYNPPQHGQSLADGFPIDSQARGHCLVHLSSHGWRADPGADSEQKTTQQEESLAYCAPYDDIYPSEKHGAMCFLASAGVTGRGLAWRVCLGPAGRVRVLDFVRKDFTTRVQFPSDCCWYQWKPLLSWLALLWSSVVGVDAEFITH
uniref:Uncharacterized protein n=1 Tax=Myotis myotis TaxID=51298 RepID=A0A7J7SRN5_MYOMY|nr:hypothetical protein mMyoMyo1_009426 [Myotis myotis]